MNQLPEFYRNKIFHGDALTIMRRLPDACVPVVITGPPVNTSGTARASTRWPTWKLANGGFDGYPDDLPEPEYVDWQRECLREMLRLIPETGAVFYNHTWPIRQGRLNDRRAILDGFPVRQIIIWNRHGGHNGNPAFFRPTYQVIYMLTKRHFRLAPEGRTYKDVWTIPPERGSTHPAAFPLEIPHRILIATGARLVLDPFMGSGTTAVAAVDLGRAYVGIEQSAAYCSHARQRVAEAKRNRGRTTFEGR